MVCLLLGYRARGMFFSWSAYLAVPMTVTFNLVQARRFDKTMAQAPDCCFDDLNVPLAVIVVMMYTLIGSTSFQSIEYADSLAVC